MFQQVLSLALDVRDSDHQIKGVSRDLMLGVTFADVSPIQDLRIFGTNLLLVWWRRGLADCDLHGEILTQRHLVHYGTRAGL